MDQASSLSDMLLKGPSVLGGVFPPASGTEGSDPSQDESFSCLVSETAATAVPATTASQETTIAEAPVAVSAPPSLPPVLPEEADSTAVFDEVAQSAADLTAALQELLALLRFGSSAVQAVPAKTAEQIDSASLSVEAAPEEEAFSVPEQLLASIAEIVDDLTEAAQVVEESDSSSAAQPLSDVIAELLALMQLVVQALQQDPVFEAGASQNNAAAVLNSSIASVNALIAQTRLNVEPLVLSDLLASSPTLSLADVSTRFYDLLQTAETTAKQVLEAVAKVCVPAIEADAVASEATTAPTLTETTAATTTNSRTTVSETTTVVVAPETTVSLAQIEATLKTVLASLKQKFEAAPTAKPAAALPQASAEAFVPLAAATERTAAPPNPFPVAAVAEQAALPVAAVVAKPTPTKTIVAETAKIADAETTASEEISLPAIKAYAPDDLLSKTPSKPLPKKELPSTLGWFGNDESELSLAPTDSDLVSPLTAEGIQAKGVYGFASTLSAFRATHGGLTGLPTVVDQVVLHMNRNVKNGESQMSLQLQPSDLGKISVKLDFGSDGKVQGSVVVENPKTLEMLQKDSRSLERALQDAGLRAEPGSLQFSLGEQQDPNNAGQMSEGAGNNSGKEAADGTISAENDPGIVDIGAISETYYITPTGVNIRV